MTDPLERHLSSTSVTAYLAASVPIDHSIPGTPPVVLFFDPVGRRIGIRGPDSSRTPDSQLTNVAVRRVATTNGPATEIAVTDPAVFADAYPLLCAIADRIQLHGQSTEHALTQTLRQWGHLLQHESSLSREDEIGLTGELALLKALCVVAGARTAISAWRGPAREEHDLGLDEFDVEIKTTTSETRLHWISSLTQLVPTGQRPLWVISLQLTDAGESGISLARLVDDIRELSAIQHCGELFDGVLRDTMWRDRFAPTVRSWRLRTEPAAFAAAGNFPRLTPDTLRSAGVDLAGIREVRYLTDLTSTDRTTLPPAMLAQSMAILAREMK